MLWAILQWHLPLAYTDNRLMARLAAPRPSSRRALSVHEEQLREPECPVELGSKLGLKGDPQALLVPNTNGGGWWCSTHMLLLPLPAGG